MKTLLVTEDTLVVRTDFSNQELWTEVRNAITAPVDGFRAYVEFMEDEELKGATKEQLLAAIPGEFAHHFLIVADEKTISDADHPLLVINLSKVTDRFGREFRALPSAIQSIENNLSIANMGFDEFADSVDEDGIFRGFPHSR